MLQVLPDDLWGALHHRYWHRLTRVLMLNLCQQYSLSERVGTRCVATLCNHRQRHSCCEQTGPRATPPFFYIHTTEQPQAEHETNRYQAARNTKLAVHAQGAPSPLPEQEASRILKVKAHMKCGAARPHLHCCCHAPQVAAEVVALDNVGADLAVRRQRSIRAVRPPGGLAHTHTYNGSTYTETRIRSHWSCTPPMHLKHCFKMSSPATAVELAAHFL